MAWVSHRHRPVTAALIGADDKNLTPEVETPTRYTAPEQRTARLAQSHTFAKATSIDPRRRIGAADGPGRIRKDEMPEAVGSACARKGQLIGNPAGPPKIPGVDERTDGWIEGPTGKKTPPGSLLQQTVEVGGKGNGLPR